MQPKYRSNNKNYPQEHRSILALSDNLEYLIFLNLPCPVGAGLTEFYCFCKAHGYK